MEEVSFSWSRISFYSEKMGKRGVHGSRGRGDIVDREHVGSGNDGIGGLGEDMQERSVRWVVQWAWVDAPLFVVHPAYNRECSPVCSHRRRERECTPSPRPWDELARV